MRFGELFIQPDQTVREREEQIFIRRAHGDGTEQVFERNVRFALQGTAVGFLRLGDAHGIDNHKVGFALRRARDHFQ